MPAGVEVAVATFRTDDPEPPLTEVGFKLPLAPEGSPLALSDTLLLNPPDGDTVTV